jgi:hypothetical protein
MEKEKEAAAATATAEPEWTNILGVVWCTECFAQVTTLDEMVHERCKDCAERMEVVTVPRTVGQCASCTEYCALLPSESLCDACIDAQVEYLVESEDEPV